MLFRTFWSDVLRTTAEKWIDGIAFALTVIIVAISKPVSICQALVPFVWITACILAVHWIKAIYSVWKRVGLRQVHETESPVLLPDGTHPITVVVEKPLPWSRGKLIVATCAGLLLLGLCSYLIRTCEIRSLLTYAYLVPTMELVECQQRAFFVKVHGPLHVSGLQIALTDMKSGQTVLQKYSGVDADTARDYFWVIPSSPWDEHYSATIEAHGLHSSQNLTVRSVKGNAQLSTSVTMLGDKNPVLSCQDATQQASSKNQPCTDILKLPPDALSNLDVSNYQSATGNVTARHVKELPSPSELDEESDDRHLTEYQQQIMRPVLLKYANSRITIFFAGGSRSEAYADEFRELFQSGGWKTGKPILVPPGNERIIDVQMSVSDDYLQVNGEDNKVKELLSVLDRAGIKHAHHFARDPSIKDGDTVLWVGPKSPKDVGPDQCSVPQLKQKPGEPHTCELIRQTVGVCPFMPK